MASYCGGSDNTKQKIKLWRNISIIVLCINLIFVSVVLCATLLWFHQNGTFVVIPHESEICEVPGIQSETRNCVEKRVGGSKLCCINKTYAEQIDQYTNKSYDYNTKQNRKFRHYSSLTCHTNDNGIPSARVVGPVSGFTSNDLVWNLNSTLSFINDIDIRYTSVGQLVVVKPGFYYVYSQVTFVEQASANLNVSLEHTVWRKRDVKEMILQGRLPNCHLQAGRSNSTSFVGAVFQLRIGDVLMVTVNEYQFVEKCEMSNYFGLHMI